VRCSSAVVCELSIAAAGDAGSSVPQANRLEEVLKDHAPWGPGELRLAEDMSVCEWTAPPRTPRPRQYWRPHGAVDDAGGVRGAAAPIGRTARVRIVCTAAGNLFVEAGEDERDLARCLSFSVFAPGPYVHRTRAAPQVDWVDHAVLRQRPPAAEQTFGFWSRENAALRRRRQSSQA